MAGTQTSVDKIIYQNDVGWGAQNPITITTNSEETYIYILAMGGDPSWYWDKREDLSGIINGKNIATISTIQQSSDISPNLTNYVLSRDVDGSVGSGTYSVTLEDVQSGFLNLTWTNAVSTPGLEVPTNRGFGLGYVFGSGEAALFRISLIDLGISGEFSFSNLTNEVGVKIDKYLGTNNEVVIPSEIDGKPVKIIGRQSFWYNTNISKVILPNSVTKLEEQAFQGCSSLIDINLPEGLTHIGTPETGGAVFYECTSLTNIIFPESLIYLHGSMFQGTQIETMTIPPNVAYVGPWAFHFAQKLQEVKFQGPKPVFGNDWLFHINPSNVVCKYISGLTGWSSLGPTINHEGQTLIPLEPYAAQLTIQTNSRGSISVIPSPTLVNNSYYEIGTQVTISAVASNSYTFSNWSGDVNGTNNPLTIALNSGKTVQANFDLADSDGDGVNDFRESQDGTDPNNPTDFNSLSKGLVAYYPFNGNANDESGNNRDGISTNITFVSDPFGVTNGAGQFNGTNSQIVVSGFNWPGSNSDRTVSVLFKPNAQSVNDLFSFGDGTRYYTGKRFSVELGYAFIPETLGYVGENDDQYFTVGNLVSGVWHHFAISISSGTVTMYLNGILIGSFNKYLNTDGSKPLVIGANTLDRLDRAFYSGLLDEFRVYDRALSSSEINSLYLEDVKDLDSNADGITDARAVLLGYNPMFNFLPILDSLKVNPINGLYNEFQYTSNRTNGQHDILNNPNSYGLYNTNQIHNLGLGGIILDRDTNNTLVLNCQVKQSTDLQNWASYTNISLPITNTPSDKMFLRVQAVGQ